MKKIVCVAILATSLALAGAVKASEQARISAPYVAYDARLSSQGVQEDQDAVTLLLLMTMLVFLAAIVTSGGSAGAVAVSDERLKTDVRQIGQSPSGLPIYSFRYKGYPEVFEGVMAQDVLRLQPDAVQRHDSGYMMVDYGKIDVVPRLVR